jgi:hypothetical protein
MHNKMGYYHGYLAETHMAFDITIVSNPMLNLQTKTLLSLKLFLRLLPASTTYIIAYETVSCQNGTAFLAEWRFTSYATVVMRKFGVLFNVSADLTNIGFD